MANSITAVKLFVISSDCNPKAELSFSSNHHPNFVTWNGIVDALTRAKYKFAMRRLPLTCSSAPEAVFLALLSAKKVGFLYDGGDHYTNTDRYQITYRDDHLMNSLPSHVDLKGLPRFHLFGALPENLQWEVVQRLDLLDYFRLRAAIPEMRRIEYSHPVSKAKRNSRRIDRSTTTISHGNRFLGLASGFCLWAALLLIVAIEA